MPATVQAPQPRSPGFPPNLALGDDAMAICFVPKASWQNEGAGLRVTWTASDGVNLETNPRVSLLRASDSSVTLGIRSIRLQDVGNYTCVASYGDVVNTVTVPLAVSGEPFTSVTYLRHLIPLRDLERKNGKNTRAEDTSH